MATKRKAAAVADSAPAVESQPSAPVTATVREYVLKVGGKQGVFSHSSEAVVRAKHAQLVATEHAQGCAPVDYTLHERTVVYELPEGVTELPTGEDAIHLPGKASERKVVL